MSQQNSQFTAKTALVTGAGGGLGRAIAEHFLSIGANVVVCDINQSLLDDFRTKLEPTYPSRTLALHADITAAEALDDLFAQATKTFGGLDFVINSAGIMDAFDAAGDVKRDMWDRVIAVNLTAPTMITQRAVKAWTSTAGEGGKASKKGVIVNIASIAGFRGFANGVAYTASKHGVVGLTKNTAAFYKSKGIRCNAIAAGGMPTNIANELIKNDGFNKEGYGVMDRRLHMEPDEFVDLTKMAKLVAYLCSEESEMINGTVVTADAGVTAN